MHTSLSCWNLDSKWGNLEKNLRTAQQAEEQKIIYITLSEKKTVLLIRDRLIKSIWMKEQIWGADNLVKSNRAYTVIDDYQEKENVVENGSRLNDVILANLLA